MGRGSSKNLSTANLRSTGDPEKDFEYLTANAVDVLPEGQLLRQLKEGRKLRIKFGIDPTAPDIHLGHSVVLKAFRRFQELGHTVVLIIGDQTAAVGDPSGKSKTRPMLDPEAIQKNAQTFIDQAEKILDPKKTEVVYNSEWLDMGSNDLFRLLTNATVAQILDREDFSKRYASGEPISMLEMLYPILQAYDSVATRADLEVGGTDQKFNLLLGRDLQQKIAGSEEPQSILTMPILTGLDGTQKMSKSLNNYVGLTDEPADMYGKLLSIPDELMPEYYTLLLNSELDPEEHPRDAKRKLARAIVAEYHSEDDALTAEAEFDKKFAKVSDTDELRKLAIPTSLKPEHIRDDRVQLPALLADTFGMSRSDARRHIQAGAVKIDGEKISDTECSEEEIQAALISVGKRKLAYLE